MTTDSKNEGSSIPDKSKDGWDKAHIIAIILIPVLVGLFGYFINASVKDKEISLKYVEIAIGILKGDPDKETPALREWAISVINSNSPVKLDTKVREELKRKPLHTYVEAIGTELKIETGVADVKVEKTPAN